MPRKKKTEEPIFSDAPTTPAESPTPAEISPEVSEVVARRKRKVADAQAPVESTPAADPAPKNPAPKSRKRAAALPSDSPAAPAEPPSAEPTAPKGKAPKASVPKKAKAEPAPSPEPPEDSPVEALITFALRPRSEGPLPPALNEEDEDDLPVAPVSSVEESPLAETTEAPLTFTLRAREEGTPPAQRLEDESEDESETEEAPEPAPVISYPEPREFGDDEDRELVVALWRAQSERPLPSASDGTSAPDSDDQEQEEGEDQGRGRGRRRRRGRRDGRGFEEPAAELEAAPEPEAAPAPAPPAPEPARSRVVIPVDAPQVVLRGGVPTLVAGRRILAPLFFSMGPTQGAESHAAAEEIRMAAEHGVHLFGVSTTLEVSDEGVDAALQQARQAAQLVLEADPGGRLLVRINITTRPRKNGSTLPSLSDDEFWTRAGDSLAELVEGLRSSTFGEAVLGVHLDRQEWFFDEDGGYEDSASNRAKFGAWLKHRYRSDVVSLRAAWFDGGASFDRVSIPDFGNRFGGENDFVRLDRRARKWVDFNLYLSDLAVERIVDLAYQAKKTSEGWYLVGASYGYTFEWSHPGSGHLSLGKLLRSADLDYVAGPPSYKSREPGGSGSFPWPIDSIALNGKLALSEEDFRTSIGRSEGGGGNPVMRTPQALESAHWRGAGAVLAHGGGLNWMDRHSLGWLNSRGIWERAQKVAQSLIRRGTTAMADPDVALYIDERSLAYLADPRAFEELVQDVREAVLRSGLSAGFYLLSDLAHRERFPDAKVHVFVNAWDMRPEVRSAIKSKLQRDNKVLLWLYCAGLFEGGRESLERAREVTGIALRPQPFNSKPGTTLVNTRDPLCRVLPDDLMAEGGTLEPSYFAIPEDASVLGEYTQTGLPSFVVRRFPSPGTSEEPWTSVFLGEPVVSPGLFRSLGQMAGAHLWSLDDDVVHVSAPFLTIHSKGNGVRTLTLPDKWSVYDMVQKVWMPVENSNLKFLALDGQTYCYLVGHKADIEAMLTSSDAPVQLSEDEVLAHQDNTVQWDSISLDVPIMKLDEWVEENWDSDMADDLLLRPSMIEEVDEEEAEPERDATQSSSRSTSSRRRGKGKGKSGKGGKRDPGQAAQESVQTLNFLFRKRD